MEVIFNPHLSSFIGRQDDLARLGSELSRGTRLVTLWGPGGVGKTRLALELTAGATNDARWGAAYFCDLSGADTLEELLGSLVDALGLETAPEPNTDMASSVVAQIARLGDLLLVFDNVEQFVEITALFVARLLPVAPCLRAIVTSRERLKISGEVAFEVSPLDGANAVQLFEERATLPGAPESALLALDRTRLVSDIVQRLDCIPLAIELAAALTTVLGLSELRDRLDRELSLLTVGARAMPARHATLRATIEWSWKLLEEKEREALAMLSLFEGAFSVEAAEASIDGPEALGLLHRLCERSLLRRLQRGTGVRFSLFRSIRSFAAERLLESEDSDKVRLRYVEAVILSAEGDLGTQNAPKDLPRAAEWAADLRAIAESPAESPHTLRAASALAAIAIHRGPVDTSLHLLELSLARKDADAEESELWKAHHLRARLLDRRGKTEEAKRALQLCLDANADAPELRADLLTSLAALDRRAGDLPSARAHYDQALEQCRLCADEVRETSILGQLGGMLHESGEFKEAAEYLEDALLRHQKEGDRFAEGIVLSNLGLVYQEDERLREAASLFVKARQIHTESGNERFLAIAELDLAGLRFEEGSMANALEHAHHSVTGLEVAGDRRQLALALAMEGALQANTGNLKRAEQSGKAAKAMLERQSDPPYWRAIMSHSGHLHIGRAIAAFTAGDQIAIGRHKKLARESFEEQGQSTDEERLAHRLLQTAWTRLQGIEDALMATGDGGWFRAPGSEASDLGERTALKGILGALIESRLNRPREALSTAALARAGWSGERIMEKAAANRVRVALSELRKLGLAKILIRDTGGYRLDPEVDLLIAPVAPPFEAA